MKYDVKRKLERNQRLVDYFEANPDLSFEEIGERFGLSRQRAWAILRRYYELHPKPTEKGD